MNSDVHVIRLLQVEVDEGETHDGQVDEDHVADTVSVGAFL